MRNPRRPSTDSQNCDPPAEPRLAPPYPALPCRAMPRLPRPAKSRLTLPCLAISGRAMPAVPCRVVPCPAEPRLASPRRCHAPSASPSPEVLTTRHSRKRRFDQ